MGSLLHIIWLTLENGQLQALGGLLSVLGYLGLVCLEYRFFILVIRMHNEWINK